MTVHVLINVVLLGRVTPLGPRSIPSGIEKEICSRPVWVHSEGLEGDEQGDKMRHGGPEKAIHHYAYDHYHVWRTEQPRIAARFENVGAFGENISTEGLTENNVCLGDVFRLGNAVVQVSQGRQPCWRLNERFDEPKMARLVQETGRTGWYYRVLKPGLVQAGDSLTLIRRHSEAWPLTRAAHLLYHAPLDYEALAELRSLPYLSDSWRKLAQGRLARRSVEDWSSRLASPPD